MGLDCRICDGERELLVWYVHDTQRTCRFSYDLCPCTGKTDHLPGERKVTEEEHDRLKLLWAKPAPPKDQPFHQAAA